MADIKRPKRALLAYCALADRLNKRDAGMMQALTPFFIPVCSDFAGHMFDAEQFSLEVASRYGLRIPRLAVLGLAEQLEKDGLLEVSAGHATKPIYRYHAAVRPQPQDVPAVTEVEIDKVLAEFVEICRQDDVLNDIDELLLQEGFLERLLHTDSMRLLSRKDITTSAKRTGATLSLKSAEPQSSADDHRELRLDFYVAQYLLDLQSQRPELFSRVSDIAFANMAAEALACFSEPSDGSAPLKNFTVYLDSPLLLDVLGINAEYAEYGKELLEMAIASGATPAVFDDCIAEAESVVAARHAALRSGLAQRTNHWGTSATPHLLSAMMNRVGELASTRGIQVQADPQVDLMRRSKSTVGDIQADMTAKMANWPNLEARQHDERSVWFMLRIRDANALITKISESRAIFVARNTALVRIANSAWRRWLGDAVRHSRYVAERWAPIAMSDKQLAGYLWLRGGTGNGTMSRARLLAHCSAAIRPRPDVKTRAYNLVLELHGKAEADILAALLEDREAERALMRATRADPEDVTPNRLPYIIEQVKLAAGEYAAERARQEGNQALESARVAHKAEVENAHLLVNSETERASKLASENSSLVAQAALDKERLENEISRIKKDVATADLRAKHKTHRKLVEIYVDAKRLYRRVRGELLTLFAACSLAVLYFATDWEPAVVGLCTLLLSVGGFWFAPEYLDKLVQIHGRWFLEREAIRREVEDILPENGPDFKLKGWSELELQKPEEVSC
jgi:hypothetical protein